MISETHFGHVAVPGFGYFRQITLAHPFRFFKIFDSFFRSNHVWWHYLYVFPIQQLLTLHCQEISPKWRFDDSCQLRHIIDYIQLTVVCNSPCDKTYPS